MTRSIEWAAGLFEGEGCVSIGRRSSDRFTTEIGRTTLVLALAMTDEGVVRAFMEAVGGLGYIGEKRWSGNHGYKPQWRWQTKNYSELTTIIDLLYPHMGERRRARMDEVRVLLEAKHERKREIGRERLGGKRKHVVRDSAGRYA